MRVLFLSPWHPVPPDNGSKIRIYYLLRGLAEHHEVTLITFVNGSDDYPSPELKALCSDVHVVQRRPYDPTSARAFRGLFSPTPRVIVDTNVSAMGQKIERELVYHRYDLIIASQWNTAAYQQHFNGVPAIFEEVELGSLYSKKDQASNPLLRARHALTLLKLRHYMGRLLPRFESCTVVSKIEAALLQRMVPGYEKIEVIPNFLDLNSYTDNIGPPEANTLIFSGSLSYFANYNAMIWFLGEVYPRIKRRIPNVQMTITGDHANRRLPSSNSVSLTGLIDDVRPLIAASWISLAPIWLGGGTRLKILEAMALCTPVVATSKGVEGLDAYHDEHLLIADTPEDFAEAVIRVFNEPGLRERLADNAFQLVREKYHWEAVMPRFLDLVERAAGTSTFKRSSPSLNQSAT